MPFLCKSLRDGASDSPGRSGNNNVHEWFIISHEVNVFFANIGDIVFCSMNYRHLFFDLDHTLWDFDTNSRLTLSILYEELQLKERGVTDFDLFHKRYLVHNEVLWEKYRKGEIRVDDLRWKRFRLALMEFKIGDDNLAKKMAVAFLELLPIRTALFPGTRDALDYLKEKGYTLHLITNGFEKTQHSKLHHSGIAHYFEKVITSEGSNSLKPHKEIFDYALLKAGAEAPQSIMIGDDAEVDIRGAKNAGIDQVFVNHTGKSIDFTPTYTIHALEELKAIF
jgi:putative hydrolase of the HAD superfamily